MTLINAEENARTLSHIAPKYNTRQESNMFLLSTCCSAACFSTIWWLKLTQTARRRQRQWQQHPYDEKILNNSIIPSFGHPSRPSVRPSSTEIAPKGHNRCHSLWRARSLFIRGASKRSDKSLPPFRSQVISMAVRRRWMVIISPDELGWDGWNGREGRVGVRPKMIFVLFPMFFAGGFCMLNMEYQFAFNMVEKPWVGSRITLNTKRTSWWNPWGLAATNSEQKLGHLCKLLVT